MRQTFQRLLDSFRRGRQFVVYDVWRIGKPGEQVPSGFIIKHIRVAILLVSNLVRGTVMLRASALTFATVLSIVPFLAIMFYVIQTFNLAEGVTETIQNRVESSLASVLGDRPDTEAQPADGQPAADSAPDEEAPSGQPPPRDTAQPEAGEQPLPAANRDQQETTPNLESATGSPPPVSVEGPGGDQTQAEKNRELGEQIANLFLLDTERLDADPDATNPVDWLIERANAAVDEAAEDPRGLLTALGILLFTTIWGLLRNIEKTLNHIWGVKRTRSWYRMISDYIIITLLMPFIAAAVLGITAALQSQTVLDELGPLAVVVTGGQQIVIWLVFTALYYAVPNTRVQFPYALLGGVVSGTLWVLLSWAYIRFQIGLTNYSLIFSGFAQFPMLLMWVYFSWVIVLFGAELSYAYQNEHTFAMERYADEASYAYREALGIRAMVEVGRRFERGEPGLAPEHVAWAWNVPSRLLGDIMDHFSTVRLVTPCATNPVSYQPARPLDRITVGEIVDALREVGRDPSLLRDDETFREVFETMAGHSIPAGQTTLADLVHRFEGDPPRLEDLRANERPQPAAEDHA